MGQTKDTTTSQASSQYTPTAAEQEMQKLQLQQYKQLQPAQTQSMQSGYGLINQLLTGGQLPGYLDSLSGGINAQDIGTSATQYALNAMPGMQSLGILDSGEAAKSISKGIANEILLPTQQFNQNQLLQMLNLASGQAAQAQQGFTAGTNTLASQLAGLRSYSGTQTQTQTSNPFLSSFYGSLGGSLGSLGWNKSGGFSFGGK